MEDGKSKNDYYLSRLEQDVKTKMEKAIAESLRGTAEQFDEKLSLMKEETKKFVSDQQSLFLKEFLDLTRKEKDRPLNAPTGTFKPLSNTTPTPPTPPSQPQYTEFPLSPPPYPSAYTPGILYTWLLEGELVTDLIKKFGY